ncbi:MAG: hypothetical protein IKP46_09180 [Bacteroidales bacterium]|nr:hypothetical protein [Bacteroidales bacterium]
MKKSIIILAALAAAVSCQSLKEEFQPVFSNPGDSGEPYKVWTDQEVLDAFGVAKFTTVSEIKALYRNHGTPVEIKKDYVLRGEITTSDENGNVYREIYIQDQTGGLDLKLGRSSSYDDYKVGQILYVYCNGLTIGEYGYKSGKWGGSGLLQLGILGDEWREYMLGYQKEVPEYETAYIDLPAIIDSHIFRGAVLPEEQRIKPMVNPAADDLTKDSMVGRLVTLTGVTYGNSVGGTEIFCLFYPNPNLNHTKNESWNRVFLSSPTTKVDGEDYTFGIKTWALTKDRFGAMAKSGVWDDVEIGDGSGTIGTAMTTEANFGYVIPYKQEIIAHPQAQSVSHYFMYGDKEVQVRTSGYSRFADVELPADVRSGARAISMTGILTRYQGSAQFTLLSVPE